jgi:TRAP-type C4-dicarboxylate transport system permease small subunit
MRMLTHAMPDTTGLKTQRWRQLTVLVSDRLDQLCCLAYVTAMLTFALILGVGVIFRYVLNNSLAWSDEAALAAFAWVTFLGAASAYLHDRHISVTMLRDWLPAGWRRQAIVVAEGFALAYLLVITTSSIEGLNLVGRTSTDALRMSMTIPYLAIPTAGVIMIVHWIRRVTTSLTSAESAVAIAIALLLFVLLHGDIGPLHEVPPRFKIALLIGLFAAPLLLGVPVAFVLGLVASMYLAFIGGINFNTGALQTFYGINVISYLAIPLLILSGNAMYEIGVARHLADFAQALVGRIRGGLGLADVVASLIFADISGSAVSDTAAIGSVMIPELKRQGYRAEFAAAIQGAAGTLGLMFPPAITLLLYATVLNLSVSQLFAASV